MKATITDVAKLAGVSIKTVSRVLNNEPNVAVKTREKVQQVASDLNYSPNIAARGLASSKSYLIALIYDQSPSPNYIAPVQRGAVDACRENGFHLMIELLDIGQSEAASRSVETVLHRLPVDGVILTSPLCDNPEIIAILKRLGIAYVPLSPTLAHPNVSCVKMDNTQAAYEMTQFLIAQGHKDIGFIKGHIDHNSSLLRQEGFAKAMADAGLRVNPDWTAQGDFSFKSGVEAAETLLAGTSRPTAIFASNDDMAAGVVSVANRMGLSVPDALSVGGFDDTPLASILSPQLTTIRQPIYQMGHFAASLLINPPEPVDKLAAYVMDHKLVVRDSTEKV